MAVETPRGKRYQEKKEVIQLKKKLEVKVGSKELKEAENHVKQIG